MQTGGLKEQLKPLLATIARLRLFLFLFVVALLYAYLGLRINTLQNAQPSASSLAVTAPSVPHINPATIAKIEQLQANSQNVRTLFNQARDNPFNE